MDVDAWRSHIPLPHILNTLVQVLKGEGAGLGEGVSQDHLEELLPHLCLALPSYSIACADLLRSLPNDSNVWGKLEKALTNKKILHPEITSVLYLLHQPALERELMRVLSLYVGTECQGPWWDEATLNISHFRPHGTLLDPKVREDQSCSRGQADRKKVNVWGASPLAEASQYSHELFHHCLSFLGSVLVKTHFSFPTIIASRDYLAQVSMVMEEELYQSFPSDLSHLAYLLSLPLAMRQEQDALKEPTLLLLIENSLREELAEGGEVAREKVCVMLCLFPFWLPVLRESGFLKGYLADGVCDVFCSIGRGCR